MTQDVNAGTGTYRQWVHRTVKLAGRQVAVATKPGVLSHGSEDTAARLLAERVVVPPGGTVINLQCGNGLFGVVAAQAGAGTVWLTDRNVLSVEASRRTLALHAVAAAQVVPGHGTAPLDPALRADLVVFRVPTDKLSLLQLLADAFRVLRVGGRCAIAGATPEGIKSAATLLGTIFGNAIVLATEGGNRAVQAIKRADAPADATPLASPYLAHEVFHPLSVTIRGVRLDLCTRPGVFSWEHLDEATGILADVMEVRPGDDVLDLGCGAGVLGMLAAQLSQRGRVTLVDADLEAIRCAQEGVTRAGLANVEVLGSDVGEAVLDRRFDVVVTNPPFHVGKATDLSVPTQFIRDAHAVLKPKGRLALVANRTLPYERLVQAVFGNLRTLHDGPRFKVLGATR